MVEIDESIKQIMEAIGDYELREGKRPDAIKMHPKDMRHIIDSTSPWGVSDLFRVNTLFGLKLEQSERVSQPTREAFKKAIKKAEELGIE